MESIFLDPEARVGLFPLFALFIGEADFCWPRGIDLFFTVLFVEESMFLDPEARIYFLQCTSFGGVDLFDPEAQIYFLQCTFFSGVDLFDPEASV